MYLALATLILRDHGQTLCASRTQSADAAKLWRSMDKNGWVEFVEVGKHGLRQCIKRKLVEDSHSELVDFVDKRTVAPRPPSFLEMIRGRPQNAY
jgi:pyruvate/oxaloacetate carboxyltransferase